MSFGREGSREDHVPGLSARQQHRAERGERHDAGDPVIHHARAGQVHLRQWEVLRKKTDQEGVDEGEGAVPTEGLVEGR